jgi:hypothetical protein
MSEEKEESGMSAIKKTIIGAITTAVTAGGAWFATHLGGAEEPKAEVPATTSAPAPVINITTNNEQKQQANNNGGGNTIIIKEKAAPAPTESKPASKPKVDEEDPW